ncbi:MULTISPECIES: hypothetical protein [Streptomyces]|uniref:Uncharacterized protein n=2 Tax=Streptomyces TaxID=1883 RepID=A0ABD5JMI6_9ACTN|nr:MULTISPECIES: hypothetical protein [Streptomyces]MEE4589084.1 hypothetical protein [Streptomyces sp. DSM 41602]QTI87409.1 hypothetical protein AS97_40955 [Streptomyces sp. AgN23]WTB10944.1 hypothetical protein OG546_46565 [Streptomyces antimycoticus]
MSTSLDEAPGPGAQSGPAPSGEEPAPAPALVVVGADDAPLCSDGVCPL